MSQAQNYLLLNGWSIPENNWPEGFVNQFYLKQLTYKKPVETIEDLHFDGYIGYSLGTIKALEIASSVKKKSLF
jgi:hypothetical protein